MDELRWCDKCGHFMILCTDGSYYCIDCNNIYKEQFKTYTSDNTNTNNDFEELLHDEEIIFIPKPHMDDRVYLCEEGFISCFVCIGKENCNQYRAKDRGLEE